MSKLIICLLLLGLVAIHQVQSADCDTSKVVDMVKCFTDAGTAWPSDDAKQKTFCDAFKKCTDKAKDCLANDQIKPTIDKFDKKCKDLKGGASSGFVVSGVLLTVSLVLPFLMK